MLFRSNNYGGKYNDALVTLSCVFASATQADDGRNGEVLASEITAGDKDLILRHRDNAAAFKARHGRSRTGERATRMPRRTRTGREPIGNEGKGG